MGALVSVLYTKLYTMIGNPSPADVSSAVLLDQLNYAMREMFNRFPSFVSRKEGSITTANGTLSYNLPSDCLVVRKVYDSTNKLRLKRKGETYYAEQMFQTTTGKPLYFVHLVNTLKIFPIPDGTYTVRLYYKYNPPDLVLNTDFTPWPTTWDLGHLLCARWFYYRDVALTPFRAQAAERDFLSWMEGHPSEMMEEQDADQDEVVELPTLTSTAGPPLDFDHSS